MNSKDLSNAIMFGGIGAGCLLVGGMPLVLAWTAARIVWDMWAGRRRTPAPSRTFRPLPHKIPPR